jgi:hypothetical protein
VEDFLIKIQRISNKKTLEQIISETPFLKMNNIKTDDYTALIDLMAEKYAIIEEIQGLNELEKQEQYTAAPQNQLQLAECTCRKSCMVCCGVLRGVGI